MSESFGHIASSKGDIVEVEFKESPPARHELLTLIEDSESRLEVYSSIGYDTVVCISLSDPTRLYRGARVQRLEKGLEVPLGEELLGRIVDLFGNPIDGLGA